MLSIRSAFQRALIIGSCAIVLANPALAATASNQFALTGYVNTSSPSSFDLAALESYASAHPTSVKSVAVSNTAGGTDTYTGISLSSFLGSFLKTDPTVPKNDILRDYVVATGTDGYRSVFSLGELNPSFGNQNDIIAYQLNGANLSTNGFARIIAPGDVKAGRWVSNLASLDIGHVGYSPGAGGISSEFTINGGVTTVTTYNAGTLPGAFTAQTVTVNTPPLAGSAFTGVSVWSLLTQAGLITNPAVKNDILGKYLIATGTDGYQAVFSLGELNPNFGNQQDLVAYATATGSSLGASGFARLLVPGDTDKAGRYVSNLSSLTVVSAAPVPLPGAALLFISALCMGGLGKYRGKFAAPI